MVRDAVPGFELRLTIAQSVNWLVMECRTWFRFPPARRAQWPWAVSIVGVPPLFTGFLPPSSLVFFCPLVLFLSSPILFFSLVYCPILSVILFCSLLPLISNHLLSSVSSYSLRFSLSLVFFILSIILSCSLGHVSLFWFSCFLCFTSKFSLQFSSLFSGPPPSPFHLQPFPVSSSGHVLSLSCSHYFSSADSDAMAERQIVSWRTDRIVRFVFQVCTYHTYHVRGELKFKLASKHYRIELALVLCRNVAA
jgi:hypothetical protein